MANCQKYFLISLTMRASSGLIGAINKMIISAPNLYSMEMTDS